MSEPAVRPLNPVTRWLHAALAWLCAALALAGVVLPGLPTTPFLLVAAWAARRGCPSLDRRLRSHRHLGPVLMHWETQRAVPVRAKWLAVGLLAASWSVLAHQLGDVRLALAVALPFAALALYIATRPAPRPIPIQD